MIRDEDGKIVRILKGDENTDEERASEGKGSGVKGRKGSEGEWRGMKGSDGEWSEGK